MSKRISYIDITRAFAIIFIVFGHTINHSQHCNIVFKVLYSFHVALFFIISGYLFNIKDKNFKDFFKEKFLRIMVTYFIWAVLFLLPYILFGKNIATTNNFKPTASFKINKLLTNIIIGSGKDSALIQNTSLWFLPALFSMQIIYYFIVKFVNENSKYKLIMLIPIILVAYISTKFLNITLPWGINTVLNVGIFFYLGYLLKEYNLINNDSKLFKTNIILFLLCIGILSIFLNPRHVSCIEYNYGNFTLALISGSTISINIFYISYKIQKNKILEYIGKNTMSILILHKLIILIFQTKISFFKKWLINSNFLIEFLITTIVCILAIIASLIGGKILRKINPLLIGEKNNK